MIRTVVLIFICMVLVAPAAAKAKNRVLVLPPFAAIDPVDSRGLAGSVMVSSDSVIYVAGGTSATGFEWTSEAGRHYSSQISRWNGSKWEVAGRLRTPAAFGAAVAVPGGFVYIGGVNSHGSRSGVDRYHLSEAGLPVVESLPDLPQSLEQMAVVKVGDAIYLAGGLADEKPATSLYMLDLNNEDEGWKLISHFPGAARVQPVLAAGIQDGRHQLFMWGGFAPGYQNQPPSVSADGLRYDINTGEWASVLPPPDNKGKPVAVGGGNAIAWNDSQIIVAGGYDAAVLEKSLRRDFLFTGVEQRSLRQKDRSRPAEWYRYNRKLLVFNTKTNRWKVILESDHLARTGAAMVRLGDELLLFQGEVKPGVNSPESYRIDLSELNGTTGK